MKGPAGQMLDSRTRKGSSGVSAAAFGLALIVCAGIFFRLYHLDRKTFWEDEVLGAMHMRGYTEREIVLASPQVRSAGQMQRYFMLPPDDSLEKTVRSLAEEDPQHPPLYYLGTHLWVRLFGNSVAAVRSLAAIFGILALPCAFWFARELFGESRVAAAFTALIALSPFFVLYSQEAREYSLWTVVTLLGSVAFLRAMRGATVAAWVSYSVLLALGMYVFPLSALVALGQGAYLLGAPRNGKSRTILAYALSAGAGLAAFVPWFAVMAASDSLRRGMGGIASERLSSVQIVLVFLRNVRGVFFDLGSFRLGPLGSSIPNALLLLAAVALVAYALYFLIRETPYERWGYIVVALSLPPLLLVARDALVHGSFVYQARYFIPMLLGLALSVAFLFARTTAGPQGWRWRFAFGLVLAGEVASCLVSSQAATWWNKDYERAPAVASIVNARSNPLVASNYYTPSALELSLYLRPDVPLRLSLRCAQCALAPAPPAAAAANAGQALFVLGVPGDANDPRARLIDARPHPRTSGELNMFAAI